MSGFQLCEVWNPTLHPPLSISEVKFDGTMVLAQEGRFITRSMRDITPQFPEVRLPTDLTAVGELCVFQNGVSHFPSLQRRRVENPSEIRIRSQALPATLVLFDVLEEKGNCLVDYPLSRRREWLETWWKDEGRPESRNVALAGATPCPLEEVEERLAEVRDRGAEGLIIKDLTKPYREKRWEAWLKLKAWREKWLPIVRHEATEAGGFVVYVVNNGYEQKVVVNNTASQQRILRGQASVVLLRFLEESEEGALRQPHVRRVAREVPAWR